MATVSELLAVAAKEVGVAEEPAGSNRVRYNTWYYGKEVSGSAYPWCMVFVQWCFAQVGASLPARTASCGALMRAAKAGGSWVAADYRAGDVVIYDFGEDGTTDHCGIVESAGDGFVTAIEGNTGVGNDANGGQVQRRRRSVELVVGAVRPVYEREESGMDNIPSSWTKEAVEWAVKNGLILGDEKGDLRLHDTVTREELMVFLQRLHELK